MKKWLNVIQDTRWIESVATILVYLFLDIYFSSSSFIIKKKKNVAISNPLKKYLLLSYDSWVIIQLLLLFKLKYVLKLKHVLFFHIVFFTMFNHCYTALFLYSSFNNFFNYRVKKLLELHVVLLIPSHGAQISHSLVAESPQRFQWSMIC